MSLSGRGLKERLGKRSLRQVRCIRAHSLTEAETRRFERHQPIGEVLQIVGQLLSPLGESRTKDSWDIHIPKAVIYWDVCLQFVALVCIKPYPIMFSNQKEDIEEQVKHGKAVETPAAESSFPNIYHF